MKAITRAVDEALDEWYAKGYHDGLEAAACRTDNRTLCKYVSEDIKERIEYYERKNRENQEEPEEYDAGIYRAGGLRLRWQKEKAKWDAERIGKE
jgi:hypothetical protein